MKDVSGRERRERRINVVAEIGEGGGWFGELAQMRLALTQRDILSHILHMSSPILSQNQH